MFRYRAEMYAGIEHDASTRASLETFAAPDQPASISPTFRAVAALTFAEEALQRGDPALGMHWIDAVEKHLSGGRQSAGSAIGMGIGMGLRGIAKLLLGEQAIGLSLLHQGREQLGKVLGNEHPQTLFMMLNEALALERAERRADASALAAQASSGLRRSLGAGSPAYIRVRALAQRLSPEPADPPRGTMSSTASRPADEFFF